MEWIEKMKRESTDDDHLLNPTTEAGLIKKISFLIGSSYVVLPIFTCSLYYVRERFMPQFFYTFADTLKYEIFFDRYIHLIEQGGLAFADRFFIAYTVVIAACAGAFLIYIPIASFFVRREMKPIKLVNKGMRMRILLGFLVLFISASFIWFQGAGLNQYGRFRADDSYILIMLIPVATFTTGFCLLIIVTITKPIFVAYDAWRDGTFREVFLHKS